MEKNTEYGAMAILSASSYGNQSKIEKGGTTTGNKSGVYINDGEWVSAGSLLNLEIYISANGKYKDAYTDNTYVEKNGDAIKETDGWHGSDGSTWLYNSRQSGLTRAGDKGIFAYGGRSGLAYMGDGGMTLGYPTRACIVVGSGF